MADDAVPGEAKADEVSETTPEPSKSDSRAGSVPESVDDRVAYIADQMRELRWERGKSAKALAKAWDLPESTVRNYSAEAHRQVMSEVDAQEAGRETGLALRRVLREALTSGDRNSVIRASEVWATISGAKAADKHSIDLNATATPAEAARLVRAAFGDGGSKKPDDGGDGAGS